MTSRATRSRIRTAASPPATQAPALTDNAGGGGCARVVFGPTNAVSGEAVADAAPAVADGELADCVVGVGELAAVTGAVGAAVAVGRLDAGVAVTAGAGVGGGAGGGQTPAGDGGVEVSL